MYKTTLISFMGETVVITPSTEMGGGIDGYFLYETSGAGICSFNIPKSESPAQEWRHLNDMGKDQVRERGWSGFGNAKHAIARAVLELGITPGSEQQAAFIREKEAELSSLESSAREKLEKLLDESISYDKKFGLNSAVEAHRGLRRVLEVVKALELYSGGYVETWASWPIPTDNS